MQAVKFLIDIVLLLYCLLESLILIFIPCRLRCKDIKGQTVLITGGNRGLGRELALRFAKYGARIVVWARNLNEAQKTVKMVEDQGGKAFAFYCDVSQPQLVYDVAVKVKQQVGKVDILVNNAAVINGKRVLESPDEKIKEIFQINTLAHFWTCKAFLPDMISENKGHIVSINSLCGLFGMNRLTDYCSSKFAAAGFGESLRRELHVEYDDKIKYTIVYPSLINTGMFSGFNAKLITVLTPEYVADQTVTAVLTNQEVVIIPNYFGFLFIMKALFPSKLPRTLTSTFDLRHAMDGFKARQKEDYKNQHY